MDYVSQLVKKHGEWWLELWTERRVCYPEYFQARVCTVSKYTRRLHKTFHWYPRIQTEKTASPLPTLLTNINCFPRHTSWIYLMTSSISSSHIYHYTKNQIIEHNKPYSQSIKKTSNIFEITPQHTSTSTSGLSIQLQQHTIKDILKSVTQPIHIYPISFNTNS